jgi:glycosyltransferase involved in cell wall biosynthesis
VDAIAAKLARLAASPDLRADLAARGRVRAAQFTWERTAARALRALEDAAASGG